jgi:hypothetical protein
MIAISAISAFFVVENSNSIASEVQGFQSEIRNQTLRGYNGEEM